MKKINLLRITLVTIISTAVIQSCQTTGKASSTSKMLKFNFEKGKGYDYEMIINMDQNIMGQAMQMDMSTYYSMDVLDDDGGTKTITSTFDRFKMNMGIVIRPLSFTYRLLTIKSKRLKNFSQLQSL